MLKSKESIFPAMSWPMFHQCCIFSISSEGCIFSVGTHCTRSFENLNLLQYRAWFISCDNTLLSTSGEMRRYEMTLPIVEPSTTPPTFESCKYSLRNIGVRLYNESLASNDSSFSSDWAMPTAGLSVKEICGI